MTYDIVELTKPDNITIGSKWIRKVNRTKIIQNPGEEPVELTERINSTFDCDRLSRVTTPAGTFDAYRIIEEQFVADFPDQTIYWYLSTKTKSVVKMERQDIGTDVVETEELLEFGKRIKPNNNKNGKNDNGNNTGFFDLNNRDFQILLAVIIILLIAIVIGAISFRRRKSGIDEK